MITGVKNGQWGEIAHPTDITFKGGRGGREKNNAPRSFDMASYTTVSQKKKKKEQHGVEVFIKWT